MHFGNYELGERIAKGGMAEVFAARRHGAEGFVKTVAIKRIRPRLTADPEFVRLFIAEARLAARLQHANIVQIYDFDEVDGTYYIAMERIHGRDLRRVLRRAEARGVRLPLPLGLHIAAEILKGLVAAHERVDAQGRPLHIVHRDLSPHNILVSFAGEVKVTDFGIAKAMAATRGPDDDPDSGSEVIRGKLPYMSPEQLAGRDVDARSDLFALGLILYEVTTGQRRYTPTRDEALIREVSEAALPDPAAHNAAIAPPLNDVIRTLLAPCPEDRFDSARAALRALRDSGGAADRTLELAAFVRELFPRAAARVTLAPDPSEPVRSPPSSGRRWGRGWALAGFATVALGLGLVALLAGRPRVGSRPAPAPAASPSAPRGSPRPAAATRPGAPREVPPSPSRSRASAVAASVRVESEPAGAEVVVDGLPTGRRAPARFGLAPGAHRVAVRWGDGAAVSRQPTLRRGEQRTLHLVHPPARRAAAGRPSRVQFTCRPWALVILQGRELGQTPQRRSLPPGTYRVRFRNPSLQLNAARTFRVVGHGAALRVPCR